MKFGTFRAHLFAFLLIEPEGIEMEKQFFLS